MSKDKPIWHGRFTQEPSKLTQSFVESLLYDKRLYKYDIVGSIAHTKMLADIGIVTKKEAKTIIKGLTEIAEEIEDGKFQFKSAYEDIHMAIETRLIEKIGKVGEKLHTARSRNDQVVLDVRLYLRDVIDKDLIPLISMVQLSFVEVAEKNKDIVMPGFTHLQHAQPVMLGAVLLCYVEQLERDYDRLLDTRKRINILPLGSCAIGGTSIGIKRSFVAKELGFGEISRNSIDAVSDRDFIVEFVFDLAMIAMHLSRWSEDWIIWSSSEFDFIEIDEKYCTGSSAMPQKRNPDVLELIRGKTGRVYGNLMNLLTILKGLPLSYNRDLQEDKPALFDAIDTVSASLRIANEIIRTVKFNKRSIEEKLDKGFLEATGLAEYLVKKGIAFREAHSIVGEIVAYCEKKGKNRLSELELDELKKFAEIIDEDVYEVLIAEKLVDKYASYGSAGKKFTSDQIRWWKRKLLKRKMNR